jgi:hypothetical protein
LLNNHWEDEIHFRVGAGTPAGRFRFRFRRFVTPRGGVKHQPHRHRDLLELPMDVVPPTLREVEASAAASGLIATLTSLRGWLGPDGRTYGANRSLVFEDSHLAASMFGLELVPHPGDADGVPLCADIEPRIAMAIAVGFGCGAIHEVGDRLVATPGWVDDDIVVRASVALSALLDLGPMQTSLEYVDEFVDVRDGVLDATVVNWLATLLPPGRTRTFDHFVDWAIGEWRQQFGRDVSARPGELELWTANGTSYLVDALAWAGAIEWRDKELLTFELDEPVRFFVAARSC